MQVSTIVEHIKYSEASNLSVVEALSGTNPLEVTEALNKLYVHINQALTELNKRFHLFIDSELINTVPEVNIYTLHNSNLIKVVEVYDQDGKALKFPSVINDDEYDIKEINYNTFMIPDPVEEGITFVYLISMDKITSLNDEVDLPEVMLEAIVKYVVFKLYGSLGGANKQDSGMYYQLFEKLCLDLESIGFGKNVDVLSKNIYDRGFV